MEKLTAGALIRLIESSPFSFNDQGRPQSSPKKIANGVELPGMFARTSPKGMSVHALKTWVETYREGLLRSVRQSLNGKPMHQPLDEADLTRIAAILEAEREIVRNNLFEFNRINPDHPDTMLQVASQVTDQIKQAITEARNAGQRRTDLAS